MDGRMETDAVATFAALLRRLYLDTSIPHNIYEFAAVIWENEPFKPHGKAANMPGLAEDIEALAKILKVTTRSGFEFVVTPASLAKVADRRMPRYLRFRSTSARQRLEALEAASPQPPVKCGRAESG